MDAKLILAKSITLLYRESLIPDKTENSSDLIRQAIQSIQTPEVLIGVNRDREIINHLKQTVLEMCLNPLDHDYIKEDLLQTIRSNCDDDDNLYESIAQGIQAEMSDGVLKRSVIKLRKDFHNHFREEALSKLLNKASWEFRHERGKIKNLAQWVSLLSTQLEPFQIEANKKDPAIIDSVVFEDEQGIESVFDVVQNENSGKGVIRFGWQALNEMLMGGVRPGEYVFLMAMQHNWKTGFSLTLFEQIPIYNKPYLKDPTKKPLLIRISFEDPLKSNFQFLYKSLIENETREPYAEEYKDGPLDEYGTPTKIPVIPASVKTRYIRERLQVNGWHIEMKYVNPMEWTYKDLHNLIIERESQGFEVKVCMTDYLQKLPTTGCDTGPMGHEYKNLLERTKAFFASKDIIFMTPWQLSSEAKMEKRDGRPDFIPRLVGGGYTNGCKTLDQIYDIGILFGKEYVNRDWYLDIALDKLRRVEQPDDKYRRFALKFNNTKGIKGVILDDIGKPNSAYKKPGGQLFATEDENETYFDF